MMDSLGDRMKDNYENAYKISLPKRLPVIIRLDGKAFHSLSAIYKFKKPFDLDFIEYMNRTALQLCRSIQGVVLAYVQSDEISLLLHNYKKINSQAWFNNELQKMVSISASIASVEFSSQTNINNPIYFDARAFILPESEVCNYFIWRQKDWERNSIQMLAHSLYSHKELQNKNTAELNEMCFKLGHNWNDLNDYLKRGRCAIYYSNHWTIDNNIPQFTLKREYIEDFLKKEE